VSFAAVDMLAVNKAQIDDNARSRESMDTCSGLPA
jgi:hypothetical protein